MPQKTKHSTTPVLAIRRAAQIERLLSSPSASANLCDALQTILIELATELKISVDHPTIVRTFYLEAVRVFENIKNPTSRESIARIFSDIARVLDDERMINHVMPFYDPSYDYEAKDDATVVDLSCWRQSHPRPIGW
jgi:hypothetical protein